MLGPKIRSPLLHDIFANSRQLQFAKGDAVTSTDKKYDIMFVRSGFIKRYLITDNGSKGVQIVYGPQDVFSFTKIYTALLNQSIYDGQEVYYYEAMSDTQVYVLNSADLASAVQLNPQLYQELFSEAGQHLKVCVHNLENASFGSAYAKVAHHLHFFAKEFGVETKTGWHIRTPMTHQDIADMLNMTRETVTLILKELKQKGLISGRRGVMKITNIDKLQEEVFSK